MALQVWLPLNGDLKNKGVADVNVTNSGATVDSNGKIGQCYKFGTSASYVDISKEAMNGCSTEASVCFWLKINTFNTAWATYFQAGLTSTAWTHYIFGFLRNNSTSKCCFAISDTSTSSQTSYLTPDLSTEVWYHFAITYKPGHCCIYVNGTLYQDYSTSITADFSKITRITLGKSSNRSSYQTDCCMNDFRIYDHCLSAAEVKEISRGLVLHYKLDTNHQVLNNVFTNPTFNTSSANGGWSHWAPSGSKGTYSQNTDTNYIFDRNQTYSHKVSCTEGNYYICYQSPAFEGGYRSAQAIIKLSDGEVPDTSKIRWSANALVIAPTTKFTHLRDGFYLMKAEGFNQDGSNDLVSMLLFQGTTVYISEAYLENNKKLCSDLFNQNSNIEYDSSGYGNHGTITGTLDLSNDTIRYEDSTLFNGVDSCITVPYKKCNPDGIFTMNLWFKKDSLGTKNYETLFGGPSGFEMDTRAGSTSTLSLYMASTRGGNVFSPFNFGEWYMVTMVRDGTNEFYYINGELKNTITAKSMPSGDYFIGAWRTSALQNYCGYISDFRLYCTTLSEEDIRQLYEVSAKIDNLGNLHSYEFVENENNKIEKVGVSDFNLKERTGIASIYKQVNPNLLQGTEIDSYRYERISGISTEFGKTFTPTQQLETETYYTFSAMIRGNANMNLYTINTGGNVSFQYANKENMDENEFKLFSVTFRVTGNRTINQIYLCSRYGESNTLVGDWYEVQENSVKLEEGRSYTPWIPAETDENYRNYNGMLVANQFIEI